MDEAYLGRSLNQRTTDVVKAIEEMVRSTSNSHAAKGLFKSGATVTVLRREALAICEQGVSEAVRFAFNYAPGNLPATLEPVKFCAHRIVQVILDGISPTIGKVGLPDHVLASQLMDIRQELTARKGQIIDDYIHGMQGSERLKKDPAINVINNQINSPGAVQQVGIGDGFSQSAYSQHQAALLRAVDDLVGSSEFGGLPQESKDAVADIADALKNEVGKPTPDAGKLKRWGSRLVQLSQDLGLRTAANVIADLLAKIFGG